MSNNSESIASALRTLNTEINGLSALSDAMDGSLGTAFEQAVDKLKSISGRVIVTGVGKSGHIGSKITATFASTGTPSHFVHSAEANHGDLGMITKDDAIIGISWSGETAELKGILAYSRRFSIPLIAICRNPESALGKMSDICLVLPKEQEACPHGLAPTTSTMMQLAIGDALAVALLEARGFTATDFGVYHPGGSLGASLTKIEEIMHWGDALPKVDSRTPMSEAIAEMSQKGFGCVCVVDGDEKLLGIITDGDLRRNISSNMMEMMAQDIMTPDPVTISPKTLASSAMAILDEKPITSLVVAENGVPTGIVHLHDLLRAGVI